MSSQKRNAWLWVLLGVAAVAAVSLLVSGCGEYTDPTKTTDPEGFVKGLVCDGSPDFAKLGCVDAEQKFNDSVHNEILVDATTGKPLTVAPRAPVVPCSPINFAEASSQVTLGADSTGTAFDIALLDRQADGSFTAPVFSVPAPMISHTGTELASLTQAQSYFASCFGVNSWTPAPHATRMADTQGAMASGLQVANLGGGKNATIIANPVINTGDQPSITVWLDTQDTLGQSKVVYPLPYQYPLGVLAADFNGDGNRDIAVLNRDGPRNADGSIANGTVQILPGNGTGALGAAKSYAVGASPSSMTWFDFNHDGRADLAVLNQGDSNGHDLTVTILLGNADGTMHTGNTYDLGYSSVEGNGIVAGDFDGDGKADLIVYDGYYGGFYLLHGNGDGTFQVGSKPAASASGYSPQYLAAGDFNRDGKLDVAVDNDDGTVAILWNAGDGSFPTQSRYVVSTPRSLGSSMFAMDFNDDGNLDLVFANGHPDVLYPGSLYVTVLFGNGDGTFQNAPAAYGFPYYLGDETGSLAMADFNGDGLRDLVMPGGYIALGQSGGFQSPKRLANVSGQIFTAADLNGDGHADLVAIYGTNLYTYLGNGDGTFQAQVTYNAGPSYPQFVTAGDVNGDGRPDVVVAYGTPWYDGSYAIPASVLLFTSKSGGGFNTGVTVATGTNTQQVALADVNGDGKLDLIAVNLGQADLGESSITPAAGNVTVSLGKGDGTFQAPVAYTVGRNPTTVTVADVNGDGKPDLVVGTITAADSAEIAVLLGKGDGTFTVPTTLIDTYSWPAGITVADFDGDGKPDLAIVNSAGDSPMTIMQGNGDGTFQIQMLLLAGDTPAVAIAADFTGDGRPDLAILDAGGEGNGSSYVTVFRNTSPTSACTYSLSASATSQPIAAAGGTGSFNVIAGTGCDWIAFGSADWIRPAFPSWGTNNGTVKFSVLANTGATRTGTVTVGGKTYTVTQSGTGAGSPQWTIAKSHSRNFTQGQNGAAYAIHVSNSGTAATSGVVTVTETLPSGLTLVSMAGQGWTCPASGNTCTRSDALNAGANYPDITVTVNVSASAPASVTNQTSVSGGGASASASASDPTTVGTVSAGGTPQAVSVSPAAGSWTSATYTFTFSDSAGWQSIGVANVLINNFINRIGACYVAVAPSSASAASVYLVDDAGDAGGPYQGMVLPGSGTVQNSQCSISGTGSSIAGSGNTLTVALAITFKTAFAGNKIMYMAARESGGANSGWQALGTCGIPGGSATGPAVGGVTPARSSGSGAQAFTFTFTDTNGWQDLGVVNILINDALNGNQACYLAYSRPYNTLYLVNDTGTALLPGMSLSSVAGSFSNSQCTVSWSGTAASGSGNTLTLALNLSFSPAFVGNRLIYMAARSNGDTLNSGWQAVGSRTVQSGGATAAQISVSPSSLDFGSVTVGQSPSPTKTVTISNIGSSPLTVSGLTATPPFSVVSPSNLPFTVPAGGTVVTVQFAPANTIAYSGSYNLTIASNDAASPTLVPLSGTGTAASSWGTLPSRPGGSVLDSGNALSTNLVGLYLMNEGAGTADKNLVNAQAATFGGTTVPTWNTADPSIVFYGGASGGSFVSAGTDLIFDQMPTSQITIVAKVWVSTLVPAGICEKNDVNSYDGFEFGWDSNGALQLIVEKPDNNMRVATGNGAIPAGQWVQAAMTWDGTVGNAAAAHLFINGVEQAKPYTVDGSGTLGYTHATNQPFRIGNASFGTMNGSLNGKIGYLAVYRGRILSTAEMNQLDSHLPIAMTQIAVTPASLDFGNVTVGQSPSPTKTVTISNTGSSALTVSSLTATAPFSVVSPGPGSVPFTVPAGGTVVTVQFSPSSATSYSGAYDLTIASSDRVTPSLSIPLTGTGTAPISTLPSRPAGSAVDSSNALSTHLVGLFLMNEGTGTSDKNLVDGQAATFAGTTAPTWNTTDPSIVFYGGASGGSFLNAGTDLIFDQMPTSRITIVAKVYVNTLAAAGICEKDDTNSYDGFDFGWDSSAALRLTVEKSGSDMRVATAGGAITAGQWIQAAMTWDGTVGNAAAAHLFINGVEQTKTYSSDGSGTVGYTHATNQPFRIGNASFDPMNGSINGKMAYLAVYTGRILTTAEMNQLDAHLPIK